MGVKYKIILWDYTKEAPKIIIIQMWFSVIKAML